MTFIEKAYSRWAYPCFILPGLACLIVFLWLIVFQSASLIDALGMSRKMNLVLTVAVPIIPLFWLFSWNNSRLCLIISTLLIVFGDTFSALCAPAIIGATLPNCISLMVRWRVSKLRFLVAPLLILGFFYFFISIFLGFVEYPVQLTNRMQFDPGFPALFLGWIGSLLGFTVVYPLIYFPCLLYDLSSNHPAFFKRFLVYLSFVMNGILLYGVFQFIQAGGDIRVSSIMRLPTRLGPFIVVFMTLLCANLIEAKGKMLIYWVITLLLSLVVLAMTQTRIAIIALGLVAAMLFLSLIVTKSWLLVKRFMLGSGLLLSAAILFTLFGNPDMLKRFDSSQIESGNSSREKIMADYQAGINLENVTYFQKTTHFLFGYGMFRERQLAHFNLHDTLACCLSVFGVIGTIFYYVPYLTITWVSFIKSVTSRPLKYSVRYGMACCAMLIFFLTGAFHNKLYSPIETAYIWLIAGFILQEELPKLLGAIPPP
jgi:hypothetical protein